MAGQGKDPHLTRLLRQVALDLEAEASMMEAGVPCERRAYGRVRAHDLGAIVQLVGASGPGARLTLVDLSRGGVRLRGTFSLRPGMAVTCVIPSLGACLTAKVVRVAGDQVALAFDSQPENLRKVDRAVYAVTDAAHDYGAAAD